VQEIWFPDYQLNMYNCKYMKQCTNTETQTTQLPNSSKNKCAGIYS